MPHELTELRERDAAFIGEAHGRAPRARFEQAGFREPLRHHRRYAARARCTGSAAQPTHILDCDFRMLILHGTMRFIAPFDEDRMARLLRVSEGNWEE